MKRLEDMDPEILDQAVRQVCRDGSGLRRLALALKLSQSFEVMEWLALMVKHSEALPEMPATASTMTAFSVGLEVGYKLGAREARRAAA